MKKTIKKTKEKKTATKRKRLIQGRDFHYWVWELKEPLESEARFLPDGWRKRPITNYTAPGKWVRVKYVPIDTSY